MKRIDKTDRQVAAKRFGPGQEPQVFLPGDFILTKRHTFMFRLLSFGEGLRFRGFRRRYAEWNHAAMIVSPSGDIVEAVHNGVQRAHISKYQSRDYLIVKPAMTAEDVDQMMKFVNWAVGKPYGLLTIISLALWSIFGGKFDVSQDGTMICSGLVARALERAGYIFERDPSHMTPADLAEYFRVG